MTPAGARICLDFPILLRCFRTCSFLNTYRISKVRYVLKSWDPDLLISALYAPVSDVYDCHRRRNVGQNFEKSLSDHLQHPTMTPPPGPQIQAKVSRWTPQNWVKPAGMQQKSKTQPIKSTGIFLLGCSNYRRNARQARTFCILQSNYARCIS